MFNNKNRYIYIKGHLISTILNDGPVFEIPRPKGEMVKKNVIYSGALDWNSLDATIRKIKEPLQF